MKTFHVLCLVALLGVTTNAVDVAHSRMLRKREPGSAEQNVVAQMTLVNEDGSEEDVEETKLSMKETVEAAEGASAGPTTIDQRFCASVLLKIQRKEAPYWDAEALNGEGGCNEDRPELLAQCEKKLDGFLEKISNLCPSLQPMGENEFKKVDYVEDVEHVETASHHKKPPQAPKECESVCEDECECCCGEEKSEPLARTPDGKPVKEWADHPDAPNEDLEAKKEAIEEEAAADCDGDKPCSADDFESIAKDLSIQEDGGDAEAAGEEETAEEEKVAEEAAEEAEEASEEAAEEAEEASEEAAEESEEKVAEEASEEAAEEAEEASEEAAEEAEEASEEAAEKAEEASEEAAEEAEEASEEAAEKAEEASEEAAEEAEEASEDAAEEAEEASEEEESS